MDISKFAISPEEAVLVVVDIQERLFVAMKHGAKVVENTLHLIEAAKLLSVPIIVTEQYPKGLGPTIEDVKKALPEYKPVEKITFGCCGEPNFMAAMAESGRKKVILVGMETHVCVWQTCQGLLAAGYGVHFVSDAVCSRVKDNWRVGLELGRDAGAVVTSTEVVLFQLLQKAGTPAFKEISKRIK